MITCLEINTRAIGNALFEYATLFGVGQKLNLNIRLPQGKDHTHAPTGQKIWQLKDIFDIKTPYISQEEIDAINSTYVEKRKEYNPEIFSEVKDNTNLIGFFQNERYFEDCEDELRKQLVFKKDVVYEAFDRFRDLNINPDKSIAIHVRRNDYVRLQDCHPVLPLEYYKAALDYIKLELLKKNRNPEEYKLLLFSDDIKSCRNDFDSDSFTFVQNEGDTANIIDLAMYSLCNAYVIANSSYSWWGAWLGNALWEKTVVAPALWFGKNYGFYNGIASERFVQV